MGTKQIYVGEEGRRILLKGMNVAATVVGSTMGATGKTVVINNKISKDGVSVAKAVRLGDNDESVGANVIKEVAEKTVRDSGDGTTASSVLTYSIVKEGFKLLAAGYNGQSLKIGIDRATEAIVEKLKSMSEKITVDSPKLQQIAAISGNNNKEVGDLVADAFVKTGGQGVIRLEQSNTGYSYLDVVTGLQFERGYLGQLFITNQAELTCEFNNPLILISEEKITTLKEISPILAQFSAETSKAGNKIGGIVFIADDFDAEALFTINTNRRNGFPICLIKSPGFGDNKKQIIEDIAAVTGASVISVESGLMIDNANISHLGSCERISISRDSSVIVGGAGKKHDVDERIDFIKRSIEKCSPDNPREKEMLEDRLAKLTGGVGVIYVGAPTEVELKEKMDRFEDAKLATACAVSEGVVVGGGIALIRCQEALDSIKSDNEDEQAGIKLMRKVLEAPFRQMVLNSGQEIMVKELMNNGQNYGYNFKSNKFEDLVEAGVIDPVKVVRVALVNAASVASTLLTTDSVIINVDDELPPMLRK